MGVYPPCSDRRRFSIFLSENPPVGILSSEKFWENRVKWLDIDSRSVMIGYVVSMTHEKEKAMFSDDQVKCPCCDGVMTLDLVEGWMTCPDCGENFGSAELREAAKRLTLLAAWLEQAGELADRLQKAEETAVSS